MGMKEKTYNFSVLTSKLENKWKEVEDYIDLWISEQNCQSENEWQNLYNQAEKISWDDIAKDFILYRIEVKLDHWKEENEKYSG